MVFPPFRLANVNLSHAAKKPWRSVYLCGTNENCLQTSFTGGVL